MDDGRDGVKKEKIFFSSRGECGKKYRQTDIQTPGIQKVVQGVLANLKYDKKVKG